MISSPISINSRLRRITRPVKPGRIKSQRGSVRVLRDHARSSVFFSRGHRRGCLALRPHALHDRRGTPPPACQQQHRRQFDRQNIRPEQRNAHRFRANRRAVDARSLTPRMAYTMTASIMADKTAGPIHTCGFSHWRSCSISLPPRLSIITTNTNSTMMAPA